ncbi:helix-turn-helix transcriptional regulator [Tenacibaculum finnmarkense]|uniref:helix-turn-helix transcriptional regulator n=1 Tax=Tenacibaculum finnmarkense TaxID=2781243 RepID=UPI003BB75C1F
MPKVKNVRLRYRVLERCFCDTSKKYFIGDLEDACEKELGETISTDTIRKDIKAMKDQYKAPIVSLKEGKKAYYRYSNLSFSFYSEFTPEEKNHLESTIKLLASFKGLPQFNWIDDIQRKLSTSLNFEYSNSQVVFFESNEDLEGFKEFFSVLFNAVIEKKVISITYNSFDAELSNVWTIHPYILKEYNHRWFLLGFCEQEDKIFTLPLDRIKGVEILTNTYKLSDINFEEYFDDVVGVTIYQETAIQEIKLKFSSARFPYVKTKPIHPYQKIDKQEPNTITIEVIPNNELIAILLSFGKDVIIVSPVSLRDKIKAIYQEVISNY